MLGKLRVAAVTRPVANLATVAALVLGHIVIATLCMLVLAIARGVVLAVATPLSTVTVVGTATTAA